MVMLGIIHTCTALRYKPAFIATKEYCTATQEIPVRPSARTNGVLHFFTCYNFSCHLRLLFFCFVAAICDLMHDVETIFHISYVLTASGNIF